MPQRYWCSGCYREKAKVGMGVIDDLTPHLAFLASPSGRAPPGRRKPKSIVKLLVKHNLSLWRPCCNQNHHHLICNSRISIHLLPLYWNRLMGRQEQKALLCHQTHFLQEKQTSSWKNGCPCVWLKYYWLWSLLWSHLERETAATLVIEHFCRRVQKCCATPTCIKSMRDHTLRTLALFQFNKHSR